jgi:hypothetical protein
MISVLKLRISKRTSGIRTDYSKHLLWYASVKEIQLHAKRVGKLLQTAITGTTHFVQAQHGNLQHNW